MSTAASEQTGTKLSEIFSQRHGAAKSASPYDAGLILVALALATLGLVIVTSASMPVADRLYGNPSLVIAGSHCDVAGGTGDGAFY